MKITNDEEAEDTYIDVALAVKGDDSKAYKTMIHDILETMEWEKVVA